jgi:hypothetical protein
VPDRRPIDRAFFRTADDGTTVFFPWGLTHRGYRLPDDAAKRMASRAASMLMAAVMASGIWAAEVLEPVARSEGTGLDEILGRLVWPGAALLLAILSYAWWTSRFVEHFPESDLQVSREERMREAARLAEPRKVAVVGVVLCVLSAALVWLQPTAWWLGLLGVASGLLVLKWSSLLGRAAEGSSGIVRRE